MPARGSAAWKTPNEMAALAAAAVGVDESEVLVLSTGIIGEHLPMQKIESGIRLAAEQLGSDFAAVELAARGMMTTDTRSQSRVAAHRAKPGPGYSILGMAKGAAMIGPKMATMLGILLTDAPLDPETAQNLLRDAVDDSFNCISVEGHMSTNDTVLLLANGAAGGAAVGRRRTSNGLAPS